MQATIESNRQYYDDNINNITEDLTEIITSMMDQIKFSKSSPYQKDSPKAQDPDTVVPSNSKDPPL